jgi:hypothetical protein
MTKRRFSILLAVAGQAGCVVYDESLRREWADVAVDARRDGAASSRDASADRFDVADMTLADAPDAGDSDHEVRDASSDPLLDGRGAEDGADVRSEAGSKDGGDGDRDAAEAPLDALRDPPVVGCSVDFTVSGVTWDTEPPVGDAHARGVRLVGDIGALGGWEPTWGLLLDENAPGAWSASIPLFDRITVEFKFVKMDPGRAPQWEQWVLFDSNRSLMIDCSTDGGTVWLDAATEAGPASRAVGRSYAGAFGVKPLDATK